MRTLTRVTLSAIFCLLVAGLAVLALSEPAYSQGSVVPKDRPTSGMACLERSKLIDMMDRVDRHHRGIGLVAPLVAMEIFVSETGDWTAVMTTADGRSCLISAGKAWQHIPAPLVGTPS